MTVAPLATGPQIGLSADQIDLVKRTICVDSTDDEFALFVHACNRSGLDPFARQIFAVKRWDARAKRESMTIQTSIDGYRLIAERTGSYAGSDDPSYVEANDGSHPTTATVTVWKFVRNERCAFTATARWAEYCQANRDGKPAHMWARMPYLMLGKCAESLALRKAFPANLAGLYTSEEMAQADEAPMEPMPPTAGPAAAAPPPDAEIAVPDEKETPPADSPYFRYLRKCREVKTSLGQNTDWYYEILEEFGMKKSNEVGGDLERMRAVVERLIARRSELLPEKIEAKEFENNIKPKQLRVLREEHLAVWNGLGQNSTEQLDAYLQVLST